MVYKFEACNVLENIKGLCDQWINSQPTKSNFASPPLTAYINEIIRTATTVYALDFCKHVLNKFFKSSHKLSKLNGEDWDVYVKPSWILEKNFEDGAVINRVEETIEDAFGDRCSENYDEG